MQQDHTTPLSWLQAAAVALQWPAVAGLAYWAGRVHQRLEHRVNVAEKHLTSLVERHMPAIHRALAEIRGMLTGRQGR
jgi:hypothetical protein